MTVRELFDWCEENNCADYQIKLLCHYPIRITDSVDDEMVDREYSVDDKEKVVML